MVIEKQIDTELSKINIGDNKFYTDWIQFFMDNGVTYDLAKAMAWSKCFEVNSEVNYNEFCNRW